MLRRPAGKLSGGERKMLAMGRVLMLRPAAFLLDEPTANLAHVMGGGEVRMRGTPAELTASQDFVRSFLGGRVAQG